jgi:hypothetical protein
MRKPGSYKTPTVKSDSFNPSQQADNRISNGADRRILGLIDQAITQRSLPDECIAARHNG